MAVATPNQTGHAPSYNYAEVTVDPKQVIHEVAQDWKWLMAAGIIAALGGALAIMAPVVATAFVATVIAATLFVVGCVNMAGVCYAPKGRKLDYFLTGVVQALLAAVMVFYPFASVVSLTILAAAMLMIEGVARCALAYKGRELPGWGWMFAAGLVTIALSALVIAGLPAAAFWVLGLLVGVSLITSGAAQIGVALEARRIAKATE